MILQSLSRCQNNLTKKYVIRTLLKEQFQNKPRFFTSKSHNWKIKNFRHLFTTICNFFKYLYSPKIRWKIRQLPRCGFTGISVIDWKQLSSASPYELFHEPQDDCWSSRLGPRVSDYTTQLLLSAWMKTLLTIQIFACNRKILHL